MLHKPNLEENPRDCESPNYPKERPAPASAQIDEQEGRVSPGDQQIDSGVVADLENSLEPPGASAVVERRGRIEADESDAVDHATHNSPRTAAHRCEDHQHQEARDA